MKMLFNSVEELKAGNPNKVFNDLGDEEEDEVGYYDAGERGCGEVVWVMRGCHAELVSASRLE